MFRYMDKKCRRKMIDLVYATFNHNNYNNLIQMQEQATNTVSCNLIDGIIFPGYDKRLTQLQWKTTGVYVLGPNVRIINPITRRFELDHTCYKLPHVWESECIYSRYCSSLPLILDQTLTFEHRLKLIETYIHPLSDFFNDIEQEDRYISMTFYAGLSRCTYISSIASEKLEPYISHILDLCLDWNVSVMSFVSIVRYLDMFNLVFDALHEVISLEKIPKYKLYKLLLICLELNHVETLKYLMMESFYVPFLLYDPCIISCWTGEIWTYTITGEKYVHVNGESCGQEVNKLITSLARVKGKSEPNHRFRIGVDFIHIM